MKEFDAITFTRNVSCGRLYVIVNEIEGAFDHLIIKGSNAKEALCGEVWMRALARILTYALRRSLWEGTTKKGIVQQLLNNSCYGVPNSDHTCSCVDAIGKCVLEYLKARGLDGEEKVSA